MRRALLVLLMSLLVGVAAADQGTAPLQLRNGVTSQIPGTANQQGWLWNSALSQYELVQWSLSDFLADFGTDLVILPPDVNRGGGEIGNVSTELAGSTGAPAGSCSPGQIHINRNTGLTGEERRQRVWICCHTDTWCQLGGLLASGLAGGQTLNGGTAAADGLTLEPSTSTAPTTTGLITLCAANRTLDANTEGCARLMPGTITLTGAVNMDGLVIGGASAVVTSDANTLADIAPLRMEYTHRTTGTGFNFGHFDRPYGLSLLLDNQNSNATGPAYGGVQPYRAVVSCQKSGAGTNFTATPIERAKVGTIGVGCTHADWYVGGNADMTGTNNGTITRLWGWHANAPTIGTDRYQFGATEHTLTAGAVPAGEVIWGGETGNPGRFATINENEGRFYPGPEQSWTGSTNGTLAADTTTRFFPINGRAVVDTAGGAGNGASATEADHDIAAPCAAKIHRMACAVNAAPTSTHSRTFTVREAAADTAAPVACTITGTATTCSWCETSTAGCSTTGAKETIAAGAMLTLKSTATGTPAASDASCVIHYTCDVW